MTIRNDIERLFRAHYVQMHRMAVALLHDGDTARDIVHDVFVSLLEGRGALGADNHSGECEMSAAYLMNAVRNRCLNHIRNCDIHRRIENRYFIDDEEYDNEDWPDDETVSQVCDLIRSEISPQARTVVRLRFAGGRKFSEIAATMGISETAVYRHMSNALTIIRKKLNENG